MDIRRSKTCERCKTVVPMEKVRLFPKPDGRNQLVCEPCSLELKKPPAKLKVANLPPPDYVTYHCAHCDYSFRVDRAKADVTYNLHCPYCGRKDRLQAAKR